MTDESRIHSAIAIEPFFEGKNHQSLVDIFPDKADSSLTPRPELRAYVINDRYISAVHLASYTPVEGWGIDNDGEIWAALVRFANQLMEQAIDLGKMAEDFGDANNRKILGINNGVAACGAHCGTTGSKKLARRVAAANGFDELSPVHFSRGLAGRDQNPHEALKMAVPVGHEVEQHEVPRFCTL